MKYFIHLVSLFNLIIYVFFSYLNDLKFIFKKKYKYNIIFIAGMPLSATTYIKNMVGLIPDYRSRLMPMSRSTRNNQDISNTAFLLTPNWSYSIFKTHLNPKKKNIDILKKNKIKKIVVSFRDPRDVVVSRYYRLLKFPKKKYELHSSIDYNLIPKKEAINHSIELVCKYLIPWVYGWMEISKQNPNMIYFCKYEELTKNPEEQFRKILKFYEINLDDDQIKRIILKTKGTNDMTSNIIKGRFQPMALSSNYRKGGTGYWKDEFSNENIDLFNKLAGDALRKLNYE
tara:strand:+ start:5370 stop:6227 length:858 start_codon:yes stop_codon:yes gene_type:complete